MNNRLLTVFIFSHSFFLASFAQISPASSHVEPVNDRLSVARDFLDQVDASEFMAIFSEIDIIARSAMSSSIRFKEGVEENEGEGEIYNLLSSRLAELLAASFTLNELRVIQNLHHSGAEKKALALKTISFVASDDREISGTFRRYMLKNSKEIMSQIEIAQKELSQLDPSNQEALEEALAKLKELRSKIETGRGDSGNSAK